MNEPFPDEIGDAQWVEAHRRADAIRRFLRSRPDSRSVSDVLDLARELGVSKATAYRLVKAFRAGGTVMSLVDRKRGRPEGHSVLDDAREEIIRTTINAVILTPNRPSVSELVRKVGEKCIAANLSVPHRRTVIARLKSIDLQKRARRRGESKIAKSTEVVPGSLTPSRPLELVQIDHTRADIFVVDEETRQPIGRPWLTLAMDVCSRMVTGFYVIP
jgi:putative transposase